MLLIFYISNYSVKPAFGDNLTYQLEYNAVSEYEDKIFVIGGLTKINGTDENSNKIFTFKLPDDGKKDTTWTTIAIISGTCGFMLLCGFISYLACARSKKVEETQNPINYANLSK